MSKRWQTGNRRHRATFSQHDGTLDAHGTPTYTTSGDWDAVVSDWPCEFITSETLRGKSGESRKGEQVMHQTTHILYGEYYGASAVTTDMRCTIASTVFGVVDVANIDGDSREMRIELRREI